MSKRLFAFPFAGALILGLGAAIAQPIETVQGNSLSRDEAVALALGDHPGLAAATESARAADARARQSGLRPNPTLELQLEDFGGGGPLSGLDGAQATYTLSQKIELGGDRAARQRLATREADAARLRAGLSAIDLREAVERAFIEAQGAEAVTIVAEARVSVAQEFAGAVDRRVRAARDPEAARARVAARLAETESQLASQRTRAAAAKAALASYWAGDPGVYTIETRSFFMPRARTGAATASPDIALAEAERDSAAAGVGIEQARRVPDPDVRAGFRQLLEIDESAFIVGVSVPLPVWNRNSGAIAAATAEKRRAEYAILARERELAREIAYLQAQQEAARAEIEAYRTRIIPAGERALSETRNAYNQGGLSYIEVLDAQGALADAREAEIAALMSFHRAEIRLARLTGAMAVDDFQENSQ